MNSLSVLVIVLLFMQGCRNNENPSAPPDTASVIDMLNGILLVTYGKPVGNSRGQICIINPDGSDLREVTQKGDSLSFIAASWSPDLERLAVVWVRQTSLSVSPHKGMSPDGSNPLYLGIANTDGRIASVLQRFITEPASPIWSPDGKQIAVTTRDAGGFPQCFVFDVPEGRSRQVTHFDPTSGTIASPIVYGWEGNNELLTCVRNYAYGTIWFEFWKMDLAGVLTRRIFEEKGSFLLMPDTYGDMTVCSYSRPGGTSGLLAFYDVDSTAKPLREELIDAEYGQSYGNPKLSPDGKSLCFSIKTATEAQVFVKDLTTNTEKLIYSAPAVSVCDWK